MRIASYNGSALGRLGRGGGRAEAALPGPGRPPIRPRPPPAQPDGSARARAARLVASRHSPTATACPTARRAPQPPGPPSNRPQPAGRQPPGPPSSAPQPLSRPAATPSRSHQARPVTVHSQQAASRQACPAAAGPAHRRTGQGPMTARPQPREGEPQGPYPVLGGDGPPPAPWRVRKKVCPGSWVRSGADPRAEPLLSQVGGETRRSGPHLRTLVTRPEPTVRPPSRMAKPRPSSMAMGWMSSTVISVVSPGMTISVPSGRVMTPVTSVVRK